MRENNIIGKDVDLRELAGLTKNYSGAEINGNQLNADGRDEQ
jgi:vesicle-fusing ATPase